MRRISLSVPKSLDYLHLATDVSRKVWTCSKLAQANEQWADILELVVSEAVTNAIKYAQGGHIQIEFKFFQSKLVIFVKDQGKGFDSSLVPTPNFDRLRRGKLGLHIIKSQMDQVSYYKNSKWHIIKMTKHFLPPPF